MDKSFSIVRTGLVLGGSLIVGFAVYQFVKVDEPKPVSQSEVEQQQQRDKMMMEARRITNQQKIMDIKMPSLTPELEKEVRRRSTERYAAEARRKDSKIREVIPGGFGPPGAGVPYIVP